MNLYQAFINKKEFYRILAGSRKDARRIAMELFEEHHNPWKNAFLKPNQLAIKCLGSVDPETLRKMSVI